MIVQNVYLFGIYINNEAEKTIRPLFGLLCIKTYSTEQYNQTMLFMPTSAGRFVREPITRTQIARNIFFLGNDLLIYIYIQTIMYIEQKNIMAIIKSLLC